MAEKIKARKKGKRKWKRNVGILLCVTAFIVIITLSALQQRNPQPSPVPKKPAKEYFSFSDVIAFAKPRDPQNISLLIDRVVFTIKAVGGNATNVIIRPLQGMVRQEDFPYFDKLIQGESKELLDIIDYPVDVPSTKEAGGWPLSFRISCNEAEGEVTIYVHEFFSLPS